MQGMDGYEFIRRARQNPDYDEVPIIIISTEAKEGDKQKGFSAGANLYLVKPTDASRIVESMKMLLGTR
jgi:two-component system chemotaxis response regulator CheY